MSTKNSNDDTRNKLFNQSQTTMSKEDISILFEQYKIYVETADKLSDRRYQANSFFLTINTALITGVAGFFGFIKGNANPDGLIILVLVSGIVLCFVWRKLIRSYSELNKGKFGIIHLLEQRLPARLFDAEWEILNRGDGTRYTPFTKTELNIPLVFIAIYIILSVSILFSII